MEATSIIIVSWNARKYLSQCLWSLAEVPGNRALEVVVVDNASSDGSPEMVTREFPRVRLVQTGANLGFAKGNNLGISMSSGRYLALINSDVEVKANCLERLVAYMEDHHRVGLMGPGIVGGDGLPQRSCFGFPSLWNMLCRALALDSLFPHVAAFNGYEMRHWNQDTERPVDVLSGCFWLARREAVEQVGGLDETFFFYGEDMDWCRRFHKGGWGVVFFPDAQAVHYGGASSANAPIRFYLEQHRADLQYWRKHHGRVGAFCFRLILILHNLLRVPGRALCLLLPFADRGRARYKLRRSVAALLWLLTGYRSAQCA